MEVLDCGASQEHAVVVQDGFDSSNLYALSTLNNNAAMWLHVWLSLYRKVNKTQLKSVDENRQDMRNRWYVDQLPH